jgi:hypothetical protein
MTLGDEDFLLPDNLTSNCICVASNYKQQEHCNAFMFSNRYVNTMYIHREFRCATFVNYDTARQRVGTKHKPCVRASTSRRPTETRQSVLQCDRANATQPSHPNREMPPQSLFILRPRLHTIHHILRKYTTIHSGTDKTNRS